MTARRASTTTTTNFDIRLPSPSSSTGCGLPVARFGVMSFCRCRMLVLPARLLFGPGLLDTGPMEGYVWNLPRQALCTACRGPVSAVATNWSGLERWNAACLDRRTAASRSRSWGRRAGHRCAQPAQSRVWHARIRRSAVGGHGQRSLRAGWIALFVDNAPLVEMPRYRVSWNGLVAAVPISNRALAHVGRPLVATDGEPQVRSQIRLSQLRWPPG
jgi:hypothetical protein